MAERSALTRKVVGSTPTSSAILSRCGGTVDTTGLEPVAEKRGSSNLPTCTMRV